MVTWKERERERESTQKRIFAEKKGERENFCWWSVFIYIAGVK